MQGRCEGVAIAITACLVGYKINCIHGTLEEVKLIALSFDMWASRAFVCMALAESYYYLIIFPQVFPKSAHSD